MKRNDALWNTVRAIAEHELEWFKWIEEGHLGMSCRLRTLSLHPAYGLPDRTRLTILRDAAALGVKHSAETHKVHPTVIYRWRKALLDVVIGTKGVTK